MQDCPTEIVVPRLDRYHPAQLHVVRMFPLAFVLGDSAWLVSSRRHRLYWVLFRLGTNQTEVSIQPLFFSDHVHILLATIR